MLTGDRPTGRLHLGHYAGSLANRIRLHRRYQSFFIVADLHMLTTKNSRADIAGIGPRAADMVLDSLAAGLDPAHSVFYLQSGVPEVAELSLLLSSLVSVPRLQRIPSLKEMARHAGQREMPFALLGYPGAAGRRHPGGQGHGGARRAGTRRTWRSPANWPAGSTAATERCSRCRPWFRRMSRRCPAPTAGPR
jgi:tryptophanyl-tRNA synthetase